MPVTIHEQPNNYDISGNPLIWVFSSNQTGQSNFSFQIEVSINGVLKETHKIFPESGDRAHFNASDIAERNASIPSLEDTVNYDAKDYIEDLDVNITESYGTPPVNYPDDGASSKRIVVKGKQRKRDFISYNSADYIFGNDKLWLTKFPRSEKRYINLDNDNKFSYFTNSQTITTQITLYDSSGGVIDQAFIPPSAQTEVSISNINETVLLSDYGFGQADIDSTSYLTIKWYDNFGLLGDGELLTLWIDDRCLASTSKHILFMNTLGGLEPYTFTKRSKEEAKITSKGIEKNFGYFDDSSNWDFSLGGNVDFLKVIDNSLILQTDYIPEDEYNWLVKELFSSPVVYLYEDGGLTPIKVTNSKYQFKTSENDMIFKLTANFERERDASTNV